MIPILRPTGGVLTRRACGTFGILLVLATVGILAAGRALGSDADRTADDDTATFRHPLLDDELGAAQALLDAGWSAVEVYGEVEVAHWWSSEDAARPHPWTGTRVPETEPISGWGRVGAERRAS